MNYDTIDNYRTMSGGEGTLLANRYRIIRQLGQGGMGSVWLAEDTLLDNKQFAIKMLPSILVSNKRAYAQLKSEALVAMKLSHPNIVTLRAFEENDGNPFLVMDYVDGQTLDDYLADVATASSPSRNGGDAVATSGLSEQETIRILKPIAAALDYAHSQGVVHRDVKPANVMIRKDGVPFILDFGISREIHETMTRVTGRLSSGTLLYMSPEQLRGLPPKPAQDVYSFAAMAYECMKGEPPFSRGQIEFQILNEQPEPLPGGPGSVPAAIMSGLAKQPEDRPVACAAVLDGSWFQRNNAKYAHGLQKEQACASCNEEMDEVATRFVKSGRRRISDGHIEEGEKSLFHDDSRLGSPAEWDVDVSSHKVKFKWQRRRFFMFVIVYILSFLCFVGVVGNIAEGLRNERRAQEYKESLRSNNREENENNENWYKKGYVSRARENFGYALFFLTLNLLLIFFWWLDCKLSKSRTVSELRLFSEKKWFMAWQHCGGLVYKNDPYIQFFRGVCALEGLGGETKDKDAARQLFLKSARQGVHEAYCALGYMSQHGLGCDVDLVQARVFYSEARNMNMSCKLAERLLSSLGGKS